MPQIDDQIRARVDEFVAELSDLIRAAAFQAVEEALGGAMSSAPARRGPGGVRRKKKASRRGAGAAAGGADRSEAVLAHIRSNPGLRLEELASELGTASGALRPSVQRLLAEGRVRTEGRARGTRYFAGGGGGGRGATKKKRGGARRKAGGRRKAGRRRKRAARRTKAPAAATSS